MEKTAPAMTLPGSGHIPLAAAPGSPLALCRSRFRDAQEGCHLRCGSWQPPLPLGRCWEVVPGFLAVGDMAWSRFGNEELSCLPPAPFSAQPAAWVMAAEGIAMSPASQALLPRKLAPAQGSRRDGSPGRERARTAFPAPWHAGLWDTPCFLWAVTRGGTERECPAWESPRLSLLLPKQGRSCQGLCWLCRRIGNSFGVIKNTNWCRQKHSLFLLWSHLQDLG